MSRVKARNTKPELRVRQFLFSKGFRYRLHRPKLVGKPDIILAKYKALVFIHGCFWHGHTGCARSRLPFTRADFWQQKIVANQKRDKKQVDDLINTGWRVAVLWQCALTRNKDFRLTMGELVQWLFSNSEYYEAPHV